MNDYLYEDLAACFAALINVLEKHGIPRSEVAEAFQERFLTMQSLHPVDTEQLFVLLHAVATQAEKHGRDD
ncbi:hypothetical protein [Nitrosomonas oligotropha]|uniref:Uncharacterized protein n=1 Tax=Nitrosomonas oligotropha TaxID=42354 RepID=A0A1H8QKV3_9PROT|nr:hypothetical protein [Nitrosomonas oligotropha]SDX53043.1 hypothetical protein SAMN05216300_1473 [Nitrosomonas oligotropha]SEO54534.1 hypothetical protein SAMN05216333_11218 [Nitrosomonas oligotropha]